MSDDKKFSKRKSIIKKKSNQSNHMYVKILTLGDSDVGKTSFINKFTGNTFDIDQISTIGNDIQTHLMDIDGQIIKVGFYDTAGQEKYKAISLNLIRNAEGIILMYDITKESSYNNISSWMDDIKENKGVNYPLILVGNKCDLEEERVISTEKGEDLADKYGLQFFETSNKDGTNINKAGKAIIKEILEMKKKQINEITNTFFIMTDKEKENIVEESKTYKNPKNKKKKKKIVKCF